MESFGSSSKCVPSGHWPTAVQESPVRKQHTQRKQWFTDLWVTKWHRYLRSCWTQRTQAFPGMSLVCKQFKSSRTLVIYQYKRIDVENNAQFRHTRTHCDHCVFLCSSYCTADRTRGGQQGLPCRQCSRYQQACCSQIRSELPKTDTALSGYLQWNACAE